MHRRVGSAVLMAGSLASLRPVAVRTRRSARFRQRLVRYLPVALLAVLLQLLAPVIACTMAAAAGQPGDLVICHGNADVAPTPSDSDHDRTACSLNCILCCLSHAAGTLDTPALSTYVAPSRRIAIIDWRGTDFGLVRILARFQAQPRGPPFSS
ncbi:MAG: DUF2946 family protein [Bradyrhizobium sp.]